jgi:hypothetical protein
MPPAIVTYTLSTVISGTGTGTLSGCAGSYWAGQAYSCTVTPGSGSKLTSVTGCSGILSDNTYSGTMPSGNCAVTATFTVPASIGAWPDPRRSPR